MGCWQGTCKLTCLPIAYNENIFAIVFKATSKRFINTYDAWQCFTMRRSGLEATKKIQELMVKKYGREASDYFEPDKFPTHIEWIGFSKYDDYGRPLDYQNCEPEQVVLFRADAVLALCFPDQLELEKLFHLDMNIIAEDVLRYCFTTRRGISYELLGQQVFSRKEANMQFELLAVTNRLLQDKLNEEEE